MISIYSNRYRRWRYWLCGVFCLVGGVALAQTPIDGPGHGAHTIRATLSEAIRLALQNNAKVRAGDHTVAAAEAQLREAFAGGWPIFDYEYNTGPMPRDVSDAVQSFVQGHLSWHQRGKLAIGVPLYAFGKIKLAKALAGQGIAAAGDQQGQESAAVVTKVRQIYYGIQLAGEIGRLLTDAIQKVTTKIAEGESDEVGAAETAPEDAAARPSPIDRLRLRTFRAELQKRLAETRMKQTLAREGLRLQMGLPPGTMVALAQTRLAPVHERLPALAVYQDAVLTHRPEARLIEAGMEAKRLQVALERRKPLPDVGLGGFFELGRTFPAVENVTTTDDFTNPFRFTRAGLGVQVKGRFDPHGQSARVEKLEQEYLKANLERGIAREGLLLEVQEAYLKAKYGVEQLQRARETEKVVRQLVFLTRSNYELGIGEKQEYAESLQLLLLTRSQYYEAVFQYNVAVAELEQKAGLVHAASSD
ncbi:MAG: TolC family protein [Deltaproteobacteria bacterium]|nr:TolC family protein [Deltaproteobacteria bacterium]